MSFELKQSVFAGSPPMKYRYAHVYFTIAGGMDLSRLHRPASRCCRPVSHIGHSFGCSMSCFYSCMSSSPCDSERIAMSIAIYKHK